MGWNAVQEQLEEWITWLLSQQHTTDLISYYGTQEIGGGEAWLCTWSYCMQSETPAR